MFELIEFSSVLGFVDIAPSLDLLAQAGGGGGFGGGGGGGGGFGGGGGGGGDGGAVLIYLALRFAIRYPYIAIPLFIFFGFIMYLGKNAERDSRITRTIRRGRKVQESALQETAIGTIRQRDPNFDEEVFLQRAAKAFVTTQNAWSEQNLKTCRAFISDGVHERFELYIAMQKAENIRNRMRDVTVTRRQIVAVTSDQHFDTMHVQFTASAISYNEDLKTKKRVSGNSDNTPISFTEIWSFSRRPGVKTDPEASLLQGNCPNCGGPVEIVDKAKCPQCDSIVNSGQYDWVLAEITQDEEWVVPTAHHQVDGWDQLASKDPGLNFQHLEDRASVIFWRSLMAVYFEDPKYAAPVLDAAGSGVPKLWALSDGQFWKTPAVGVVEVVRGQPATEDDEFDRIYVLVRWSGIQAEGDRRQPRIIGHQRIYSHSLILKRRKGVTSKTDQAFSSFSCHSCGAPINIGKADVCEFCDAPINDGSMDWVLEDVSLHNAMTTYGQQFTADSGAVDRFVTSRLLNEPELFAALVRMVVSDGELHDKERKYLTDFGTRRGISKDRLKQIFASAVDSQQPIQVPEGKQGVLFMEHLIRAALLDGQITSHEKELLLQVSGQLNWAPADLKHAIQRARSDLFRQAKAVIRNQKKRTANEGE
jgi:hypothetical protein